MDVLDHSQLILLPDQEMVDRLLEARNLTEDIIEDRLKEIKDWLKGQSHLTQVIDEKLLKCFVSKSKTMERAKQRLEKFYEYKNNVNLSDKDPCSDWYRTNNKDMVIAALPQLTVDGTRLLYVSSLHPKPKYSSKRQWQQLTFTHELLMLKDHHAVDNSITVVDCKNMGPWFLFQISPMITMETTKYSTNAVPLRIKGAYFFNIGPLAANTYSYLIRPLLSKKLQQRVFLYSEGPESLSDHVPLELLPSDLGGNQPSIQLLQASWKQMIEEHREWLIEESGKKPDIHLKTNKADQGGGGPPSFLSRVYSRLWHHRDDRQ